MFRIWIKHWPTLLTFCPELIFYSLFFSFWYSTKMAEPEKIVIISWITSFDNVQLWLKQISIESQMANMLLCTSIHTPREELFELAQSFQDTLEKLYIKEHLTADGTSGPYILISAETCRCCCLRDSDSQFWGVAEHEGSEWSGKNSE